MEWEVTVYYQPTTRHFQLSLVLLASELLPVVHHGGYRGMNTGHPDRNKEGAGGMGLQAHGHLGGHFLHR